MTNHVELSNMDDLEFNSFESKVHQFSSVPWTGFYFDNDDIIIIRSNRKYSCSFFSNEGSFRIHLIVWIVVSSQILLNCVWPFK